MKIDAFVNWLENQSITFYAFQNEYQLGFSIKTFKYLIYWHDDKIAFVLICVHLYGIAELYYKVE